jgi:hypothetical protein
VYVDISLPSVCRSPDLFWHLASFEQRKEQSVLLSEETPLKQVDC